MCSFLILEKSDEGYDFDHLADLLADTIRVLAAIGQVTQSQAHACATQDYKS